tara:strand:+ start:671 stop:847 length:177 start_codon:yes stop_codon:yes gene_type:complete
MKNFKQKSQETSYLLVIPMYIKMHKPGLNQQVTTNPYILNSMTSLNAANSLAIWEVIV